MNIHPDILALIHADIDGVATEAEQSRLRDAISRDAAVRDEYRRLRGLSDVLARIEPAEPPPHMAPNVMRAVRATQTTTRRGFLTRLRAAWPTGPQVVRYGYALAAGTAIGVVAMQLASGGSLLIPSVKDRDASATIGNAPGTGRVDLTPAGIPGSASLRSWTSGAAIGLDLTGSEPIEFVLRYNPAKDSVRVEVLVVREGRTTEAGSLRIARGN